MPWASIIMALLSFFLAKKKGLSNAKSALVAGAVGLGTYYLADPSNPDNLFKIGVDSTGTGTAGTDGRSIVSAGTTAIGDVVGKTIDTTGKVLMDWGPTGTAAVIGTTAIATSDNLKKWLPWLLLAGGAILLLK